MVTVTSWTRHYPKPVSDDPESPDNAVCETCGRPIALVRRLLGDTKYIHTRAAEEEETVHPLIQRILDERKVAASMADDRPARAARARHNLFISGLETAAELVGLDVPPKEE